MNKELNEQLVNTINHTILPIKVKFKTNIIPKSLWEDDYVFGFFAVFISTNITIAYATIGKLDDFNEVLYNVMKKVDPNNFEFFLSKMSYLANQTEGDFVRGGDDAEKVLYLYHNENKSLFPNVNENDEMILRVKSNPDRIKDLTEFLNKEAKEMNISDSQYSSFALFGATLLLYIERNLELFLNP